VKSRLLAWVLVIAAGLSCSGCGDEIPMQALQSEVGVLAHWLNKYAVDLQGEHLDNQDCLTPSPGFTQRGCTLVRMPRPLPFCKETAFSDGRCRAIEVRDRLLRDGRMRSLINAASRETCVYVGPQNAEGTPRRLVLGCSPPDGEGWVLTYRVNPMTICVIGLDASEAKAEVFAIRAGRRVDDPWCNELAAAHR